MSIIIENIKKSFDGYDVLKGIDFEFATGKVNMIIGASGSGKTVLLKTMVGLERPDEGRVLFDGVDVWKLTGKELRSLRKNIGMLFQSSALFDSLTVEQNIAFPLEMFTNKTTREIKEQVQFCLDRVNMSKDGGKYPSEISGGMKKRVGIARAIALNPKYLFCDEPNSGLDPKTAEMIDELIRDITYDKDLNMTTIVVTHDMKSVMSIADHIMFIYKGEKAWEGKPSEVMNASNDHLVDFIRTSGLLN